MAIETSDAGPTAHHEVSNHVNHGQLCQSANRPKRLIHYAPHNHNAHIKIIIIVIMTVIIARIIIIIV